MQAHTYCVRLYAVRAQVRIVRLSRAKFRIMPEQEIMLVLQASCDKESNAKEKQTLKRKRCPTRQRQILSNKQAEQA